MDLSERRSHYLELFETWLDRALADEPQPEGIAPDGLPSIEGDQTPHERPDLYTLFEALTALTQEIKLQGRAFRALADEVEPLRGRIDGMVTAHDDARRMIDTATDLARSVEDERIEEAEERGFNASLDLLLDLRDRLARGVSAADEAMGEGGRARGILDRLFRRPPRLVATVAALVAGQRLTLDHLDDALRSRGVSVIPCLGRAFEPGVMTAVDVVETEDVPEGEVVEVFRPGYERHDTVLRPAEVKVARIPAGRRQHE